MRNFINDLNRYDKSDTALSLVKNVARRYFLTDRVYKVERGEHFYGYVLEKLGIDYILLLEEGLFKRIITLQLKIRDSKYYMKDICIEIMHEDISTNTNANGIAVSTATSSSAGYIFDIKADYLIYAWADNNNTNNDNNANNENNANNSDTHNSNNNAGISILPQVLLINVSKLKRFFDRNKSNYDIVPTKGTISGKKSWVTYNMFIPLEDCRECYEVIKLNNSE